MNTTGLMGSACHDLWSHSAMFHGVITVITYNLLSVGWVCRVYLDHLMSVFSILWRTIHPKNFRVKRTGGQADRHHPIHHGWQLLSTLHWSLVHSRTLQSGAAVKGWDSSLDLSDDSPHKTFKISQCSLKWVWDLRDNYLYMLIWHSIAWVHSMNSVCNSTFYIFPQSLTLD